jgi:hypothetical protein
MIVKVFLYIMNEIIADTQQNAMSIIISKGGMTDYKNDIVPLLTKLIDELRKTKSIIQHSVIPRFDSFVEALSLILFEEYSQYKTTTLSMQYQVMILYKHPFLVNILMCHKTLEEWNIYRKYLCDNMLKVFGEVTSTLPLKRLLSTELTNEGKTAIQRFNFFINFKFKRETSAVIFKTIRERFLGYNFVFINASFNLFSDDLIVIYKGVIKHKLFLTDEFIQDKGFLFPKNAQCKEFYNIYDKNMKEVKTLSDDDPVIIVLSYNTDENPSESYVSVAYSCSVIKKDSIIKGSLYFKHAKRLLNHMSLKIIPDEIIEIYLQEDFYKFIDEEPTSSVQFIGEYSQMQKIAFECFSTSTIQTLRENILKHREIRDILVEEVDFRMFAVYLHGIKMLKVYEEQTIVNFVTSYLWPEIPLLEY